MANVKRGGLPGSDLEAARMPGHWLLARLGKRVLRPGGMELTRWMLNALRIVGKQPEVIAVATAAQLLQTLLP